MKLHKKITTLLTTAVILSTVSIYNNPTYATKYEDQAIYTEIDENGNIQEVDEKEINQADIIHTLTPFTFNLRSIVKPEDVLNERGVVNFRTKSGEITEYTAADSGIAGYTNGSYAADAAYLGHNSDRTKVKFMLAGVIGWVDAKEVQILDFSSSSVQTLSKYYVKSGRLYHGIVTKISNSGYASSIDVGPKPDYLKEGEDYYSYDGHYFYPYNNSNGYLTMLKDYRNDTRENSINPDNPYFNYYQFLPHRSKTVYTVEELNKAIKSKASSNSKMLNLAEAFVSNQNKYGINALLAIGVAANESSWGSSNIAQTKNNLFGHKAYDDDPNGNSNSYSTPEFSVYYHMSTFLAKGYCYPGDWKYQGSHLGDKASGVNVKYASDPYWGEKAAATCWNIDKQLNSKDSNKYTIGIKDVYNYQFTKSDIKNNAKSSSTTLYQTVSDGDILNSYPVIILDENLNNGYYKIQSDAPLNSARTKIVQQSEYSFSNDYGYISNKNIKLINSGTGVETPAPEPEPEPTHKEILEYLKLNESDNYLTGFKIGDDVSTFIKNVESFSDTATITVKNTSGTKITSGKVTTGITISLKTQDKTMNYTCVIRGDTNGDGKISALDYVKVRNHLDEVTTLKNPYLKAADVDNNSKISALDYVKIRNHLDGKSSISQ